MKDLKRMGKEERISLARKFRSDHSNSVEISRENFDIWLIDNDLADDPGTDDTASLAFKGFVQQRNNARRSLNTWAASLMDEESYSLNVDKRQNGMYEIKQHSENAFAVAADLGNRVDKFAKNRLREVSALRNKLEGKAETEGHLDEVVQMLGVVKGHGIVMNRKIKQEVVKFNAAVERIESKIQEIEKQLTDGSDDVA